MSNLVQIMTTVCRLDGRYGDPGDGGRPERRAPLGSISAVRSARAWW